MPNSARPNSKASKALAQIPAQAAAVTESRPAKRGATFARLLSIYVLIFDLFTILVGAIVGILIQHVLADAITDKGLTAHALTLWFMDTPKMYIILGAALFAGLLILKEWLIANKWITLAINIVAQMISAAAVLLLCWAVISTWTSTIQRLANP